jgi:hypothetical protein
MRPPFSIPAPPKPSRSGDIPGSLDPLDPATPRPLDPFHFPPSHLRCCQSLLAVATRVMGILPNPSAHTWPPWPSWPPSH